MSEWKDILYPAAILGLGILNYLASRKKDLAAEIGEAIERRIQDHRLDPHAHDGFFVPIDVHNQQHHGVL